MKGTSHDQQFTNGSCLMNILNLIRSRSSNAFALLLYGFIALLSTGSVHAQVSMTSSPTTYSQDFNTLNPNSPGSNVTWTDNTTIAGWFTNQGSYRTYSTGDATPTNRIWACGSALGNTDRALGSMMTSSTVRDWGVKLTNNTGSTLTSLTIGLDAERWYTAGTGSNLIVQYSTTVTTLGTAVTNTTGASTGWTTIATINSPSTGLSYTINSLSLANGSTIFIRFFSVYMGSSSNVSLWATDNFTANWGAACTTPASKTVSGTAAICSGSSTNVTLAASQSGVTYDLFKDGTSQASTQAGTGSDLTWSVSAAGTYTVKSTTAGGYCATAMSGSAVITIKTNVGITSVTAPSASICASATQTLTANGVVGTNATVTWYSGAGGTGTNYGTGTTLPNVGPGTYYARVTGDCGAPAEASVTVSSLQPPSISTESLSGATYTQGDAATPLNVTASGDGTLTYQWYQNTTASTSGATPVGSNSNSYTPSTLSVGTSYYYVVVSGCSPAATSNFFGAIVVDAPVSPVLLIDSSSFDGNFGNKTVNSLSAERSFTVSGSSLADNVVVTAPAGFEVSSTSGSGFGSSVTITASGSLSATTIYVRFAPTSAGSYSGNISIASTGATTINAAVSGEGTVPAIALSSSATMNFAVTGWTNSTSQSITVNGTFLDANVSVSVDAPFQVSTNNSTWGTTASFTQSGGTASGTLYVRYNPSSGSGDDAGTVTLSSTGASNQSFSVTGKAAAKIVLASGSNTQAVKAGVAITNIVYTVTGGVTGSSASGLPSGLTLNGSYTISGAPGTETTYPATYNYTVTINGPAGTTDATATGTITVKDPNAKKVAFLYTTVTPPTGSNKIYSELIKWYDVTPIIASNVSTDTATIMADLKNNYDMTLLHENINSGNLTALALGRYIGVFPILNTKPFMYGKANWPAGSGNNANTAYKSARVRNGYQNHPIFNGITLVGDSVVMAGSTGIIRFLTGATTTNQRVIANSASGTSTEIAILEDSIQLTGKKKYVLISLAAANEDYTTDGLKVIKNACDHLMSQSIFAQAGANGSVTPAGETDVATNGSQSYTITPDAGYAIADVLVDGVSVGAVTSYSFTNVTTYHSISASFSLIPCSAPDITGQPSSSGQTLCVGDAAAELSVTATGSGTVSYQWYSNVAASNSGGTLIGGATNNTYTPSTSSTEALYYYCVVTNDCGANSTSSASEISGLITVQTAVGGTASGNQTVCAGNAPSTNLSVTGSTGTITKWQFSNDNFASDIHDITNASATLTGATIGTLNETRSYRAVVELCSVTAYSTSVTVTVNQPSVAGTAGSNQTICAGTVPSALTLSGYTGTIQWESSEDNSSFSPISGANASGYSPAALTQTSYYRAVVTNGVCAAATSNTVTIQVDASQTITLSSAPGTNSQTVCVNSAVTDITYSTNLLVTDAQITSGSLPSGVTGSFSGGVFTISGTPTETGVFNYTITTFGSCLAATASGSITVTEQPVAGTASGTQDACAGFSASALSLSGSTGSIQWYSSTDNSVFDPISGATGSSYSPGILAQTTYFRAVVSAGTCTSATSNTVTVTVHSNPLAATGAVPATICSAGSATISVDDPGAGFEIDWYAAASGGSSLFTGISYSPVAASNTTYYAEVRNTTTGCVSATRLAVGITVNSGASISVHPSTSAVAYDLNASAAAITITANGTSPITYQWYRNLTNSNSGGTAVGTNSNSYTPVTTASGIYYYYCVVSNSCGTATSNVSGAITVNPEPLVFDFVAANTYASLGYTEAGIGTYHRATAGGTISFGTVTCDGYNVSAPTSSSVFIFRPAITASKIVIRGTGTGSNRTVNSVTSSSTLASGYTAFSTTSSGTINSGVCGSITVTPSAAFVAGNYYSFTLSGNLNVTSIMVYPCVGPTFSTQPTGGQSVCLNSSASLGTVAASGAGTTYQWYSNSSLSNSGGTLISGANTASYSPSTTTAGTYYYYCVATASGGCTTASTAVQFTVLPAQNASLGSAVGTNAQSVCVNSAITTITYTGNATVTNLDASGLPSGVTGSYSAGTLTINGTATTAGTYNYSVVSTGTCGSAVTLNGTITVLTAPSISSESLSGATYTTGATATALSVSASGGGTLSYQWFQNSTASLVGSTPVGSNSNSYTPSTAAIGTSYYYCVVSGCTPAATSGFSGAIVVEAPSVPTLVLDQTGFNAAFGSLTVNSSSAPRTIQVSGVSLTDDIQVSAPAGFEVSLSAGSGFGSSVTLSQSGGVVNNTVVYVRFAPLAEQSYSGNLQVTSSGADPLQIALTGTGTIPVITLGSSATMDFAVNGWTSSASQSVSVSGANLNDALTVSVASPFQVSSDNSTWSTSASYTATSGTASGTLYVRYNPASGSGSDNATVSVGSTGASSQSFNVTGKAAPLISLSTGSNSQVVKAGSAVTSIVYSVTGGVTNASASGLPSGVSFDSNNFTVSGTPDAEPSYPVVYNYTITISGPAGTSNATATGSITVKDPNAKKVAFLYTSTTPPSGSNKIYSDLNKYFDVTAITASNVAADTAALMANLKNNYDMTLLHEAVSSSTLSALALGRYIGVFPILNTKSHMYGKANWPAGSGNNANTAYKSVRINTGYSSHPIFNGVTVAGDSAVLVGSTGIIRYLTGATTTNQRVIANSASGNSGEISILEDSVLLTGKKKYMLISLSAANEDLTANGLLLIRNACFHLVAQSVFASAGTHGSISPSGEQHVATNGNATFTFTPDANYQISNVTVNGVSVGTPSSYTFTNLTANSSIHVDFALDCVPGTWTGAGGTNSWSTAANWSCGTVPASGANITIATGATPYPVVSGNVTVGTLELQTGTSLTLGSNSVLTLNGVLSGNGRLSGNATASIVSNVSNTLNFNSSANTIKNLTVTSGTLTLGNALNITAGASSNSFGTVTVSEGAVLASNGNLTLKSGSFGTARVAQGSTSGNYITGEVTVERYIPANSKRAWRLLSVPTKSSQTVKQAWQENQAAGANGVPGYGTIITGNINGGTAAAVAAGFDFWNSGGSLQEYFSATQSWKNVTSTNVNPMQTNRGYFIYIRGDRSVAPASTVVSTATVLRTKGTLYQGDLDGGAITVGAGKFEPIGNTFASAIDWTQLQKSGGLSQTFYLWDPKAGNSSSAGAYQTFSFVNGYVPLLPGSYSLVNPTTTIESGQAFMVTASGSAGTIGIPESAKVAGTGANVFRPVQHEGQLITKLVALNGTSNVLLDNAVVVFGAGFANELDALDARKMMNPRENLSIVLNNQQLAIEARKSVSQEATIQYGLSNLTQSRYQLEISTRSLNASDLVAVLEDQFLGTKTPVDLNQDQVQYPFEVTTDPASKAVSRFKLVIIKKIQYNPSEISKIQVMPNPVTGNEIKVSFQNLPAGSYQIRLLSGEGRVVYGATLKTISAREIQQLQLPANLANGMYQIQAVGTNSKIATTRLVINR